LRNLYNLKVLIFFLKEVLKLFVTLKKVLSKARKENYAVGAFNFSNMEFLQAIVSAAEKLNSPVIVQTTEGAVKYAGLKYLKALADAAVSSSSVPVVLHLDHGRDLNIIKQCIRFGWTGVMIDASLFPFEKNIQKTKKVVSLAHKKGVSVEAELGTIGGAEESVRSRKIIYTDPLAAKEFVERTGIDALAVAVGTSHGAYKFKARARINLKLLKQIKKTIRIPLVLHGASSVPLQFVKTANKFGAKIAGAHGLPDSQLRLAIKNGINKVNTDTDLRLAFDASVRKYLKQNPEDFDPRHILGEARNLIQKTVEHRISICGSVNKK